MSFATYSKLVNTLPRIRVCLLLQYTSPAAQRYRKQLEKEVKAEKASAVKAAEAEEVKPSVPNPSSNLESESEAVPETASSTSSLGAPTRSSTVNGTTQEASQPVTKPVTTLPPTGMPCRQSPHVIIIVRASDNI